MMINRRLIGTVSESKKYVAGNVVFQWCSLISNIVMMASITNLLCGLYKGEAGTEKLMVTSIVVLAAVLVRFVCTKMAARMGYLSSKAVKKTLREMIYKRLLRLGNAYKEKVQTSEIVQVAVEGVDQLETYFGAYLPQFFYAMLAPLTLFVVICFLNVPSAIVLLICVPLIPVTIVVIQRWAKRLLAKYWGQYTALGDTFLENLQGLTTLKIYQADDFKHKEMNVQSENFRKITMKVLTMQLNSITIMDLIAYGGAALGVILSVTQYRGGHVSLEGCLLIILLSADFFIPMRQLGSFFHVAMNGMAACDKIFRLLDLPEDERKTETVPQNMDVECSQLCFGYEKEREILHNVNMVFPKGSFTSIVGASGCGKSTIAQILMGRNKGYTGSATIGDRELSQISEESLMENLTLTSSVINITDGNGETVVSPDAGATMTGTIDANGNAATITRYVSFFAQMSGSQVALPLTYGLSPSAPTPEATPTPTPTPEPVMVKTGVYGGTLSKNAMGGTVVYSYTLTLNADNTYTYYVEFPMGENVYQATETGTYTAEESVLTLTSSDNVVMTGTIKNSEVVTVTRKVSSFASANDTLNFQYGYTPEAAVTVKEEETTAAGSAMITETESLSGQESESELSDEEAEEMTTAEETLEAESTPALAEEPEAEPTPVPAEEPEAEPASVSVLDMLSQIS